MARHNCSPWGAQPPEGRIDLPLPKPESYDLNNDPEEGMEESLVRFPPVVAEACRETRNRQVEYSEIGAPPVLKKK